MRRLQPYLIFPGNCEEALNFYAVCLGGEIVMLQRYSESPLEVAAEHGNRIFNSAFHADGIEFMASDNLPENAHQPGSNFSMFVTLQNPAEQARVFELLGWEGCVLLPLQDGFGMVRDRFDVSWMLALEEED